MKKTISLLLLAGSLLSALANPTVHWSVRNLPTEEGGTAQYIQKFTISGMPDSTARVAFNMFARQMSTLNPDDSLIELIPGYYAIESSRIGSADTTVVEILTRGTIKAICYSPDGVHGVGRNGGVFDIDFTRDDLLNDPIALSYAPKPEEIYAENQSLTNSDINVYDVIPAFKEVTLLGGITAANPEFIRFCDYAEQSNPSAYQLTIDNGSITVEADSALWAQIGLRLRHWFGAGVRSFPRAIINDYPDLEYRGLMIDVARNFQPASEIHRFLDLMAVYGLNTFHFHLTDDEAWRLEIPALPELTEIGSRRGYVPEGEERQWLPQIFAGNGNPNTTAGTANGYYTREEFISILRHADSLAINVIPEIESPGHARAAIVAMRHRPEYRLDEVGDTSRYTSAQAFHDNVMNPGLQTTYNFMQAVIDAVIDLYAEADVPLKSIHIGGDEVPRGAWNGSPAVRALMEQEGLTDEKSVHAWFVSRVSDYIASKGVLVSGWQEIALRHPDEYNNALRPKVYSVNCWSTLPRQGQGGVITDIANANFPIILSNVDHFYMDMCYSPHPNERGLSWGGYVDEFDALDGYAQTLAPNINVLGIQGQLFAETIRSTSGLENLLLPKMLGLAERAWNNDSTYTNAQFNAIAVEETGKWYNQGLSFHVRQPGAKISDNYLYVNSTYPIAIIRWTSDGTEPNENSRQITENSAVNVSRIAPGTQIRVRQWIHGIPSASSVLIK